ncbi:MAG: ferrous iron transport protein B [Chloroflexi bacterium]|nr:ferrous iron transport protein B [Chloroflexota bacterium]
MSCHTSDDTATATAGAVLLVGNPNVGKSVIFGALTNRYVTVSNYPGTTVEITEGALPDGQRIIDTPGTNSLTSASDDERVTAMVLFRQLDGLRAVIQVADAKNLRRSLLLTLQLAELGVPLLLNLNMLDEARTHGVAIDTQLLAERLGVEVVSTVAVRGDGLADLARAIERARAAHFQFQYEPVVEQAVHEVGTWLPDSVNQRRGIAVRLLCGDEELADRYRLNGALTAMRARLSTTYERPIRTVIINQQMSAAQSLVNEVLTVEDRSDVPIGKRLARWMIDPLWGWPILLAILWVVYKFVGEFGAGTLVGFMEETVFGSWINPLATRLVDLVLPFPLIHDLLVGEYGLITMALSYGLALVLPIVTTFFIAFSILEDSGYLPRLAIMFNRTFRMMGLNGKAVLPMVLGLGCDTMATLSTRILETRKERIMVTLLLALGVPCSAQLGVILGMLGQVSSMGALIWAGVVFGTMMLVGLLAAKLLPGDRSDFILELPPLRAPRLDNILIKTLARLEWYLKEVLPLFIVGTLILFVLAKTGALGVAEQLAQPLIVGMLGLPTAATGAFLIGFLRRDYGAAGLFALALAGQLDSRQIVVSLIVITLFIPCIANVLMIIKEYGGRVAAGVALTVFPLAFLVGAVVNAALRLFQITP